MEVCEHLVLAFLLGMFLRETVPSGSNETEMQMEQQNTHGMVAQSILVLYVTYAFVLPSSD